MMSRLHTDNRRSRTATSRLSAVLAPQTLPRGQKPSPQVLLAAFETILRTTGGAPLKQRAPLRSAGLPVGRAHQSLRFVRRPPARPSGLSTHGARAGSYQSGFGLASPARIASSGKIFAGCLVRRYITFAPVLSIGGKRSTLVALI